MHCCVVIRNNIINEDCYGKTGLNFVRNLTIEQLKFWGRIAKSRAELSLARTFGLIGVVCNISLICLLIFLS